MCAALVIGGAVVGMWCTSATCVGKFGAFHAGQSVVGSAFLACFAPLPLLQLTPQALPQNPVTLSSPYTYPRAVQQGALRRNRWPTLGDCSIPKQQRLTSQHHQLHHSPLSLKTVFAPTSLDQQSKHPHLLPPRLVTPVLARQPSGLLKRGLNSTPSILTPNCATQCLL